MQMLMNGWTHSERQVRWNEVFHHVVVLWLNLLLISNAMVKEGVPCVGIMLTMRQYVYFIYLLRKNIWFFNVKKRDLYSLSQIQRLIKQLEKLGLITAELFPYGFLFTWGSLYMVECRLKRKRQVQAGYSLKTDRILFF